MKKIMVTGAGGFIGRNMVSELLERNFEVAASDFNTLEGPLFDHPKCSVFQGDIRNLKAVEKAVIGCDAVIHLAGALGFPDYQLNYDIHVKGSQNVIDACKKHKITRIIAFSTIAAAKENPGHYGATKKQSEDLFLSSGLEVTIFRPTIVFGKGSKGLETIVKELRKYPLVIPMIGSGKAKRQPIWVKDIVKITIDSLENKKSIGNIYNIGGSEIIKFKEFVNMVKKELQINKFIIPIPTLIAKMIAIVLEKIMKKPPFTYENVRNLTVDTEADISKAETDLNFKPTPLSESLPKALKKFS